MEISSGKNEKGNTKMKLLKFTLVALVLLVATAFAQVKVSDYNTIVWGNGTSTSDALVNSDLVDTTATIVLKQGDMYPSRITFLSIAIEGANSDSSSTTFALDLSNDRTYWYSWGTLESIVSTATAAQTLTGSNTVGLAPYVTDGDEIGSYNFARIRATKAVAGADTNTCKLQYVKQFDY
jgi:hypothetical protein